MLAIYFLIIVLSLSTLSSSIYRIVFKKHVIDEFIETFVVSLISNCMGFGMMYVMLYKLEPSNQIIIAFLFSLIYSIIFLRFYTYTDIMS